MPSTTRKPLFIGLGHYKRTGKDTFANFLIAELQAADCGLRVVKRSLAWKLKQICFELYGWAGLREPEFYETPEGAALREVVLPAIGKSPREIWIDFGTKAVRDHVYEQTWLDYLTKGDHDADVVIVPDVRFHNEFEEFRRIGAILIKVVRPGYGPGPNRPDRELLSENRWDNVIGGSGKLHELEMWAKDYAAWVLGGRPVRIHPCDIARSLSDEKQYADLLTDNE